jgi:hypothetical protein
MDFIRDTANACFAEFIPRYNVQTNFYHAVNALVEKVASSRLMVKNSLITVIEFGTGPVAHGQQKLVRARENFKNI